MELGTTLGEAMDPKANAAAARLAELRAAVEAADNKRRVADIEYARAKAAFAEAEGDEYDARYWSAYAKAQSTRRHEDHEEFMRIAAERKAARTEATP